MSTSRFVLCAIPKDYWEQELNGVGLAKFSQDARGCERRIGKEVNLENEYTRYTLLCQQLEREVIRSGRIKSTKDASAFQAAARADLFPVQAYLPGYLALLARADEHTQSWRLGASFFFPDEIGSHLQAFAVWAANLGAAETPVVQQRLAFLQWALDARCGVVEFQSGFHLPTEREAQATQIYAAEAAESDAGQFVKIPDFVTNGMETEFFGKQGRKQREAKFLRNQIRSAIESGEPVSFGNQAPHDIITEVLHEFVFAPPVETVEPLALRIVYADGSEAALFPLFCVPSPSDNDARAVDPLRVALMSMRHLEMDSEIDFCWFRNREVSRMRTLSETDQFCFDATIEQLHDILEVGDLSIHMFHTGFEPAVIGFYRGVVRTLLDLNRRSAPPSLTVTPHYFRGAKDPYQLGSNWG